MSSYRVKEFIAVIRILVADLRSSKIENQEFVMNFPNRITCQSRNLETKYLFYLILDSYLRFAIAKYSNKTSLN